MTATNIGCDTTSCGACTVLVDGESVKSCTMLAAQADGRRSRRWRHWRPTAGACAAAGFHAEHGLQCGFCTPGMIMAALSLLAENPSPTEEEVGPAWRATSAGAPAITTSSVPCSPRRSPASTGGVMIPAPFSYRRAGTVEEALDLRPRPVTTASTWRRAFPATADEAAVRGARGAHRHRPARRAFLHPRRGRPHRDRGADPAPRPGVTPRCWPPNCRCSRTPPGRSGTRRCGTGAPSAGRWRTATPPPTCPQCRLALDPTRVRPVTRRDSRDRRRGRSLPRPFHTPPSTRRSAGRDARTEGHRRRGRVVREVHRAVPSTGPSWGWPCAATRSR